MKVSSKKPNKKFKVCFRNHKTMSKLHGGSIDFLQNALIFPIVSVKTLLQLKLRQMMAV